MNDNYIKALSVHNITNMVYAMQLHCEPGMPPGIHLGSIYGEVFAVADGSWLVWHDRTPPEYGFMTDEEFRDVYIPYNELPEKMKAICDAHPGYDEWVDIKNAEEPCPKN